MSSKVPQKRIYRRSITIKSITAKYIFKHHGEVKMFLWGGKFWTSGYYANTVGQYGNLDMITNYVQKQGIKEYTQLHSRPPTLFDLIP